MHVTIVAAAEPGQPFTAGRLDHRLGHLFPLSAGGETIAMVELVSATPVDDGAGLELVVDVPDELFPNAFGGGGALHGWVGR